jgi:hypothetical protein
MSNPVANQPVGTGNPSMHGAHHSRRADIPYSNQQNRVVNLQQFEKDVLDSPDLSTLEGKVTANAESKFDKPLLDFSEQDWQGFEGGNEGGNKGKQMGLISIIGAVLCLQAKMNSNFWSTAWKQASESMMMQVKFAPVIGDAIKGSYDAQSQATRAQADQSLWEGVINIGMFVATMGVASYMELKEPTETIPKDPAKVLQEAGEPLGNAAANDAENLELEQLGQQQQDGLGKAGKIADAVKNKGNEGQKRFTSLMAQAAQQAQVFSFAEKGASALNANKYQTLQADAQGREGQLQALSNMAEQYAQFYGQDFSRTEDLRQGAGQEIGNILRMLNDAANMITQTTNSMFRG